MQAVEHQTEQTEAIPAIINEQDAISATPEVKPPPAKDKPRVTYFSEDDITKDGRIVSQYPAWWFQNHMEDLEEEIRHDEYVIDRELIEPAKRYDFKQALKAKKEKLDRIRESTPKLNERQRQKIDGYYHELSQNIKESMFTYTQMQRGTADAHEEARRMSMPCIKIPADIAKVCNIKLQNGMGSRNQATKAWKIMGRILGRETNQEVLRKG